MAQEMLSPLEIRYPISFNLSGSILFFLIPFFFQTGNLSCDIEIDANCDTSLICRNV